MTVTLERWQSGGVFTHLVLRESLAQQNFRSSQATGSFALRRMRIRRKDELSRCPGAAARGNSDMSHDAHFARERRFCVSRKLRRLQTREHRQCLRVQCRCAREHAGRIERKLAAFQSGKYAARFAHDDRKRGDVEDVHVRFDHQIEATACEQVIVQKIAVTTNAPAAPDQFTKHVPVRLVGA